MLERVDVRRLAGDVREPVPTGPVDERTLDRSVRSDLVRVRAEKVAQRQVPKLVGASGSADVDVVRAGPLRRLGEEAVPGRLGIGDEQVPQPLDAAAIGGVSLDRCHGQLQIDDRLCSEPGNRRRADVVQTHRDGAQDGTDAFKLRLGSDAQAGSCSTTRVAGSRRSSSDG